MSAGDTVFIHGAAATPALLVDALTQHGLKAGLQDVTVCHIHTEGKAAYTKPECEGRPKLSQNRVVVYAYFFVGMRLFFLSFDAIDILC